jgi:hypothetical protein
MTDDRAAVAALAHGYGIGCDDRDPALLRTLFADTARAHYGTATVLDGGDAIVAWLTERTAEVTWSQHVITPRAVVVDGDAATCRATLVARQRTTADPTSVLVTAGEYHLVATRTADGWRLTELSLTVGWTGRESSS